LNPKVTPFLLPGHLNGLVIAPAFAMPSTRGSEPLDDILPNAPNLRLIEHRRRQPMPQVLGIDHIAFAAHDLEATCVFYDQLFGARTHF
jgi:hypothetical protein